jgi:hypothetical protein
MSEERTMTAQKPSRKPAKIQDLPVRNAAQVKGGGLTMLGGAVSNAMKNIGGALQTVARG